MTGAGKEGTNLPLNCAALEIGPLHNTLPSLHGIDNWLRAEAKCSTATTSSKLGRYRSGTVNSKSFVGKVLLRIKRKFELTYAL